MTDETKIDLQWIFAAIRHQWLVILSVTALVIVGTFFITAHMPLTYKATVTLLISSNEATAQNEYSELVAGEKLTFTFSEMLKSWTVLEAAIQKLGLDITPEELDKNVSADPVKNTQLVTLSVVGDSPEQAVSLANAIAEEFKSEVKEQISERYAGFLQGKQQEMEAAQALYDETQSKIDDLSNKKNASQAKLTRLDRDLTDLRDDYRTIQQNHQTLNLTVSLLKEKINIIERAQTPVAAPYEATVTLLLNFTSSSDGGNYSSLLYTEPLALTYGNLVTSQPVLQEVIDKLGVDVSADNLAKRISVNPVRDTQLLKISVSDAQASQAALLANTIAEVFIGHIQEIQAGPYLDQMAILQRQVDQLSAQIDQTEEEIETLTATQVQWDTELGRLEKLQTEYRDDFRAIQQDYEQLRLTVASSEDSVTITSPANTPSKPIQNRFFYVLLAAILGVLVSLGITFLREQGGGVIRTAEDVRQLPKMNILGMIGKIPKQGNKLAIISHPQSASAEAVRTVATNIRLRISDHEAPRAIAIAISSPSSGEGKTLIAANLAIALAESGLEVILVDADLNSPKQHEIFEISQTIGLSDALSNGGITGKLQSVSNVSRLKILPSGEMPLNPSELFISSELQKVLSELKQKAKIVLLDCPPLLPVAYGKSLVSAADGVLLVVKLGKTQRRAIQDFMENLDLIEKPKENHDQFRGVILNDSANRPSRYYRYPYHGERKEGKRKGERNIDSILQPIQKYWKSANSKLWKLLGKS